MELEKSNRTLNRRNFRNKEAFQHTLGYLNLLCDKYGIRPIFIHAVNFKMELLKTFERELDFFSSARFIITHSSAINPFQYSVGIIKDKKFKTKPMQNLLKTLCAEKKRSWHLRDCRKYLKIY